MGTNFIKKFIDNRFSFKFTSLPPSLPPSFMTGNDLYKDIEGLSNSLAIASNKGIDKHLLRTIGDDDAVWDGVAHALGSLCATLVLMVSVERIVISGGKEGGREGGREVGRD